MHLEIGSADGDPAIAHHGPAAFLRHLAFDRTYERRFCEILPDVHPRGPILVQFLTALLYDAGVEQQLGDSLPYVRLERAKEFVRGGGDSHSYPALTNQ